MYSLQAVRPPGLWHLRKKCLYRDTRCEFIESLDRTGYEYEKGGLALAEQKIWRASGAFTGIIRFFDHVWSAFHVSKMY